MQLSYSSQQHPRDRSFPSRRNRIIDISWVAFQSSYAKLCSVYAIVIGFSRKFLDSYAISEGIRR